jgi:hypothetical protein
MSDSTLDGSTAVSGVTQAVLRTVTFQSVLWGVARLCGWKPESRDLTVERAAQLTEFINERVREAWEYAEWADLRWIEQRYFHEGLWAPGSYAAGSIVYHASSAAYYTADTGTSEEPGSAAVDWTVNTSYSKHIPYEQLGQTKIGTVEAIFKSDPRINRTPTPLYYEAVDREGIYIKDTEATGAAVWLSLLVREPEFTSVVHSASTSYAVGDLAYLASTGECYKALAAGTVADPSASENWDRVEFPYVFSSFVKRAAHADYLASKEQFEMADRVEAKAFKRLDDVLSRAGIAQQLPQLQVRTRGASVR